MLLQWRNGVQKKSGFFLQGILISEILFQRLAIELSRGQNKKGTSPGKESHLALIDPHLGDNSPPQHSVVHPKPIRPAPLGMDNEMEVERQVESHDENTTTSSNSSESGVSLILSLLYESAL